MQSFHSIAVGVTGIFAAAAFATEAMAAVSFGTTDNYSVGAATQFVAVGDFNNDGYSDLASVGEVVPSNPKIANIAILLNKPDSDGNYGTFPAAANYTYSVSSNSQSDKLAIGYINGDNNLDLAVTGMGKVSILLGAGNGTFAPTDPATITIASPITLALGHLDGDTNLDLIVGSIKPRDDVIGVLRGSDNGNGTFQTPSYFYDKATPRHIALGDLDRDGDLDIVTASTGWNKVTVVFGAGNGTFSAAPKKYTVPVSPVFVAVGDVNNDNFSDLAVTSGYPSGGRATILLGNSDGTFQEATPDRIISLGMQHAGNVVIADFDGDGNRDLAVPRSGGADSKVAIFLGNGNGTFGPETTFASTGFAAFGDFNCDGKLDMAATNRGTSKVSVLLNTSADTSNFDVPDGDVPALVCAITKANAQAGADTINLAGSGSYVLTKANNGNNGLPIITSEITINGARATIERSAVADTPEFRIVQVSGANSDLTLKSLVIKGGRTSSKGAGIHNNGGKLKLFDAVVTGNSNRGSIDGGGGIYNGGGEVEITQSTISNNTTNKWGAGIWNDFGVASLTLVDSRVIGNSGFYRGTGLYNSAGAVTLIRSTISGNKGAGIYNGDGVISLTNSTVSGNTPDPVQGGGGIINYNTGAKLTLVSSTVTGNSNLASKAGGISNDGGTVTVKNTIMAGNTPIECVGAITKQGVNLFGTDDTCVPGSSDIETSDPKIGALALNAPGKTETHALLDGSPAINAATDCTDTVGTTPIATDQRGVLRPQGTFCDIGAYERE